MQQYGIKAIDYEKSNSIRNNISIKYCPLLSASAFRHFCTLLLIRQWGEQCKIHNVGISVLCLCACANLASVIQEASAYQGTTDLDSRYICSMWVICLFVHILTCYYKVLKPCNIEVTDDIAVAFARKVISRRPDSLAAQITLSKERIN